MTLTSIYRNVDWLQVSTPLLSVPQVFNTLPKDIKAKNPKGFRCKMSAHLSTKD